MPLPDVGRVQTPESRYVRDVRGVPWVSLACRGADSPVLGENGGKRELPGVTAANRSGAGVDTGNLPSVESVW
jgi:hypothetical protein